MARKKDAKKKLCPDGDWRFVPREGQTIVDGKTHYPALLRLALSKREALELAERLLRHANQPVFDMWEFTFWGTIERLEDEYE